MSKHATFEFSSRTGLQIAAIGSLIGSGAFHWMIQSQMTSNVAVALAFTTIFVLFPVVAAGFVFPTSPAGMLLMRIKLRTWGYAVLVIAATFIVGYDAYLMNAWWLTQDVVRSSGYVLHQVVLSIIGFHVLPGLLVSQVSTTEMIETIRQAHLVKRYKEQTAAEMTILRNTTMRSVELSQRGMSNLNDRERDELARIMVGLVNGIDTTMNDIARSVHSVSSVDVGFRSLLDEPRVAGNLDVAVQYLQGGRDDEPPQGPDSGERKPLNAPRQNTNVPSLRDGQGVPRDRGDRDDRRGEQARLDQLQQALAAQAGVDQPQAVRPRRGGERFAAPSSLQADQPADGPRLLPHSYAQEENREAGAARVAEPRDHKLVEPNEALSNGDDIFDVPSLFDLIHQQARASVINHRDRLPRVPTQNHGIV